MLVYSYTIKVHQWNSIFNITHESQRTQIFSVFPNITIHPPPSFHMSRKNMNRVTTRPSDMSYFGIRGGNKLHIGGSQRKYHKSISFLYIPEEPHLGYSADHSCGKREEERSLW